MTLETYIRRKVECESCHLRHYAPRIFKWNFKYNKFFGHHGQYNYELQSLSDTLQKKPFELPFSEVAFEKLVKII
ncbi:unnamed protein product, partial [Amoebophrya sp. A120]|eukprot:GSA120T00023248001.1